MNRSITDVGQIVNGKVSINTSAIYSRLIQEAARWCENYASDIFIDLTSVQKAIDTAIDEWDNIHCYEHLRNGDEFASVAFRFGFRQSGVDDGKAIDHHYLNGGNHDYYRSIWRLTIKAELDKGMAGAILQRMDP